MEPLEVRLLGEFEIKAPGGTVRPVRTQKARCLLAYLALESRQPQPRAVLAALLWPESDDVGASSQLRQAIYALRQALGDAVDQWLDITRYTVQFRGEKAGAVDVLAFLRHVRNGELEQAAALYRGPLLANVKCDSEPFVDWLIRVRKELDAQALHVLGRLAERRGPEAMVYARRQLELAPAHEPAHRQLMSALAASGDTSAALAQYEHCCRIVGEYFGVAPEAATVELAQQIRAMQARPVTPYVRLPVDPTPFVGRTEECSHIIQSLIRGSVRLLTITGPGGIGKTRLAVQAARHIAGVAHEDQPFRDGIVFVALAGVDRIEQMLPALAAALEIEPRNGGDVASNLRDFLREKSLLLVLDNVEQLTAGAGMLAELLAEAAGLSLLVTAREPLQCAEEVCLTLDGLGYVHANASSHGATPHDAAALFVQRAERARPDFDFAREKEDVLEICRLVEGMPLALELAATWVRSLPCATIVAELTQGLDLLTTPARNIVERHRSVRATLELSWQQLAEDEQAVLAALAVMRADFSPDAAQAVGACTEDVLERLVNKSLLRRVEAERYHFHELIRQFAAEKLAGRLDLAKHARDRHCTWYLGLLAGLTQALQGAGQRRALAKVAADLDNVRSAWSYAAGAADCAHIAPASDALGTVHELNGHYDAGELLFGAALEAFGYLPAPQEADAYTNLRVAVRLLAWHSAFCRLLDRQEEAQRDLARARDLLERLAARGEDVAAEAAFCDFQRARLYVLARPQEAFVQFRRNLDSWRALGNRWYESRTLAALGELSMWTDRYAEAQHFEEQSLNLRRALDDKRGIAQSLATLAFLANYRGEYEHGQRLAEESQALLVELGERAAIARSLNDTGKLLIWAGRYPAARSNLEESARLFAELGHRERLANARIYLACALLHLGDYEAGYRAAQDGLALHRQLGAWAQLETALFFHAWASCTVGRHTEAVAMCEEALAVLQDKDAAAPRGWTMSILALATYCCGYKDRAWQWVQQAIAIAQQYDTVLPLLLGLIVYARAALDSGNNVAAAQVFGALEAHPPIRDSRWWSDFAGDEIAARRNEEPIAEAIAHGAARGIHLLAAEVSRQPLPSA